MGKSKTSKKVVKAEEPKKVVKEEKTKASKKAAAKAQKEEQKKAQKKAQKPEPMEEEESEEESSSEEEVKTTKKAAKKEEPKKADKKAAKKEEPKKAAKKEESSEEESSDDSDDSSSEEEAKPAKKEEPKKAAKEEESSEEESSDDSDDSDDDSSEEEEEKKKEDKKKPADNKRKRDEEEEEAENGHANGDAEAAETTKKAKTEEGPAIANFFVGNLPFSAEEDTVKAFFEEAGITVHAVRLITERDTGRKKGFGYIEADASQADAVLAMAGADFDGREIKIDRANERPARENNQSFGGNDSFAAKPATPATDGNVFLGNLSFNSTEDSIWEALQQFGTIKGVRLVFDRETQKPRGFGYVEFEDAETANKAIAASGTIEIDGRYVRMDGAAPRSSDGGSRGGRGGGRGFGGGRGGGRGGPRGGRGGGGRGFGGGRGGSRGGRGTPSFAGKKTTF